MSRPRIFSTHTLFEAARQRLADHFDVEYWSESERPAHAELIRRVAAKDGLISLLTERIDDELLNAGPGLRMVANVAVGYDNIDLAACTRRKIAVSNTPGVLDETTADLAWALLMAVARRLIEGDTFARSGKWQSWNFDQLCGTDVWGKTLGIVGFGRIGRAMARRARGFNMPIVYYNRKRVESAIEEELHAEYLPFDQLLNHADFVSLHVPLTAETRGLIGPRELSLMKASAFLVNAARGPVVNESALVDALAAGKIAGAALDVYECEPIISEGLRRPNVVLAPHLGSASVETRTKMALMAAENLIAFFAGQRPANILNPEVLGVHS
jgi:glyoxylate reductase